MAIRDPLYQDIADHVIETDGCSPGRWPSAWYGTCSKDRDCCRAVSS